MAAHKYRTNDPASIASIAGAPAYKRDHRAIERNRLAPCSACYLWPSVRPIGVRLRLVQSALSCRRRGCLRRRRPRDPTPRCGAVLVVTMLSNPPRLASNQPDPEAPDTVWCPRDRVARLEPVHAIGPTWRCSTSHQETSHYGDDVWGYGAISVRGVKGEVVAAAAIGGERLPTRGFSRECLPTKLVRHAWVDPRGARPLGPAPTGGTGGLHRMDTRRQAAPSPLHRAAHRQGSP